MADTFRVWRNSEMPLLKQIVTEGDRKVELLTAVSILSDRLTRALETTPRTTTLYYQAEILTWKAGSDQPDELFGALSEFPDAIVKMTGMILERSPHPVTKNAIYATGRELVFSIETIIAWCQGTLRLSKEGEPISLSTPMAEAERAIRDIRSWDGYRLVRFMEYFDPYEDYQLSVLEGEGGICLD